MTRPPMLWGAGLACALGGAVAGSALGSTPMLDRSTIAMMYQEHETAPVAESARDALPDHYPLVTKAGTVPVGELGMRGLYSQARYRAYLYAADYTPEEIAVDDGQEEWRMTSADPTAIDEPTTQPAAATDTEGSDPLQLAAGPANVESTGHAKLVNVNAALAMR